MLATVLVCPMWNDVPLTRVRTEVTFRGERFVVMCELARPINRRALMPAGELGEADSFQVIQTFRLLLAR